MSSEWAPRQFMVFEVFWLTGYVSTNLFCSVPSIFAYKQDRVLFCIKNINTCTGVRYIVSNLSTQCIEKTAIYLYMFPCMYSETYLNCKYMVCQLNWCVVDIMYYNITYSYVRCMWSVEIVWRLKVGPSSRLPRYLIQIIWISRCYLR